MSRSSNTTSIQYVRRLLAGAARQGVSLQTLFADHGLDPALLDQPEARIASSDLIGLIELVMQQTHDEFIGLASAIRSKPGTFSMMAHAVINSATLEKAIRRSAAFYQLFETPGQLLFETTPNEGSLTLQLTVDTPDADTIIEVMVVVSVRFWSWLVGRRLDPLVIELAFEAPAQAHDFQKMFRCPVVYGQERNRVRFPASWLNLPLAQTPLSLSRFLRDSVAIMVGDAGRPASSLADQVRGILGRQADYLFPELTDVAARLNLTPQTLRRRLRDEGTSYQEIKDQLREDAARFYLAKPMLSIDEIALMMGFSEASAFHRAFKKWTGQTPAACRRDLLGTDHD